ncbi:MAG: sulfatase [Deltaproteobacteria bacterium]|nr:sulfatase [Deltaproteobacteria bacterium]
MRILYLDIDCLRPDHLSCYGYERNTSPNIDGVAKQGLRFEGVYASDVPCLPSRTAFFSGRFGIHTGVVNHGGARAEPFPEGASRGFASTWNRNTFTRCLRDVGLYTATISSFGERHSALHFYANFNEIQNPGLRGLENGDVIGDKTVQWLERNRDRKDWFLHVHFWDPHMPYRAPAAFGEPFANSPTPAWYSDSVRTQHLAGCGPHSASEIIGYSDAPPPELRWDYPRQPLAMTSMQEARALFDGYDTGVLYADAQIGRILGLLKQQGLLDETIIVISGDHGENLGELNVYGDHQTADEFTCHVPFILRWPGVTDAKQGASETNLHYQIDLAATLVELAGGNVPEVWDGKSFATQLRNNTPIVGRQQLVLSQGAWACQRAVRWDVTGGPDAGKWLFIFTWHDAYHLYPEVMLFELQHDPHEENDLAAHKPALVQQALGMLQAWTDENLKTSEHPDPLMSVLNEGGPKHTRGELPAYLERLRATGRQALATALSARHIKGQ